VDILETLAERGAVLTDHHFVYKSGKHGPHYINMDPVFPDTGLMYDICLELGMQFNAYELTQLTIVGPATGGIPLAVLTALALGDERGVSQWPAVVWADKAGEDDFVFERAGFIEQLDGKQVLVVEDLLNTGDSVKKVIAQARLHGANVIGVSVICNRGSETAESLGVPRLEALSSVDFQAFTPESCPLCAEQRPIVADIGHGSGYQQEHPDYPGGYVRLLAG